MTGIDGARAVADEALGLESLAAECRLNATRCAQVVDEILAAISGWEQVAREHQVHQSEIARFEGMFTRGARTLQAFS